MNSPWVLSGRAPRNVAVPQIPTKPWGQLVGAAVGCRPPLHAASATNLARAAATDAAHATRLRMAAIIAAPPGSVNLTPVWAGNNVQPAMPIYEYRCTKCHTRFSQQQAIEEHGRKRPACPACKSPAVEQGVSVFLANEERNS